MKLTTKSEYSILALIYMARNEKNGFMKIDGIGYIKTKRGTSGGYKLTKPASQISIAEVIRLMDGALAATESVSKYFFSDTPLGREKKLIKVFKEIRNYISKRLENLTLADLV